MGLPQYCTLEDVKRALDSKEVARNDAQLQRAVESASRLIESDCHRWFYPVAATRYFDWPSSDYRTPWRIWLDANEVTAVTAITSGGIAIPLANVFLEPNDLGPPYGWLEINRSTMSAFYTGFFSGFTPQRAIAVTGTFGYCDTTEPAGTLAAAVSSTSATTVTVADSSLIGTGDTILVDSERMLVTKRTMTTTAQTLQTPITASVADVTLPVTTGSAYAIGEILLLDAERMLVIDIASNNLTVKRAWDGTVLAAHTGSTIYAQRLLTVQRGLTGTTAATHLISTAVSRQTVPGPVRDLAIALSINRYLQEVSGYARNIIRDDGGSGSSGATLAKPRTRIYLGGAIPELKQSVLATYGRTRWGAI